MRVFYVLKVQGKAKIPDYIQVRDEAFTLVGYFRPAHGALNAARNEQERALFAQIEAAAADLPYGRITRLELDA